MKKTVHFNDFVDAFIHIRPENFSYDIDVSICDGNEEIQAEVISYLECHTSVCGETYVGTVVFADF